MSEKTENQTSELLDAHRGRLEENPGTGLLNVKEEDETDDMNSHQTEIHWSLPADEDNTDIVKDEITEDLFVRHQLEAPDEKTSDSICPDGTTNCNSPIYGQSTETSFNHFPNQRSHVGNLSCECEECFNRKSHLLSHQKINMEVKSFSCSGCGKGFSQKWELIRHEKTHTGEKEFSCSECRKCFLREWDLKRHLKIHTGERAFSCYECGKYFSRKAHLITHLKTHTGGHMDVTPSDGLVIEHRGEPYVCDHVMTKKDEVPINTDTGDVKTEVTLNTEQTNEAVKQEISDNISTGSFTNCSYPRYGQSDDASFHLFQNQRSHMENVCFVCGKCYTSKSQLGRHLKIHTEEKAFSCSHCGKSFTQKSDLNRHQKTHTGEKEFSCSQCGKCFTHKTTLITHQTFHAGQKAFSCSECGKSFTWKSSLFTHLKIHTGKKAFSCSECGKCFTQKSTLITHQNIHTGDKAFSCSDCGKCFTQKSTLITHQKIHTGEKAFSCSDCGKCFTLKADLIRHQKIHIKKNQGNQGLTS
ncbi:gastrula zinc finger protein XlCGF57.1-like isoform X2 [Bombina bombina]|uniref:gastrula zinc finger protein XlCGF57.1-like isoform X2 n=1 Tax=Bombina bombina TaxID=8345 RepID=UPI00235AFC1C|nr:gastrula zinc finger protein XlCGF57.1-like isoform X2 [Bombina bombina]